MTSLTEEGCDPFKGVPVGWVPILCGNDFTRWTITLIREGASTMPGEKPIPSNFAIGHGETFKKAVLAAQHAAYNLDKRREQ